VDLIASIPRDYLYQRSQDGTVYVPGRGIKYLLDEGKAHRRRILISIILTLGLTQTLYLNIPTFLPEYREKYHQSINDGEIGIILS